MNTNFDIQSFMDLRGYDTEERRLRRKHRTAGQTKKDMLSRINSSEGGKNLQKCTAEYFTPYSLVKRMADKIPEETWRDPSKNLLEPCFGNGQFLVYMIYKRLISGVDWKTTLETLYGVELMADNVLETKNRIIDLLENMEIDFDEKVAREIMDKNLVCSNFFDWDFENWRPLYNTSKSLF